MRINQKKYEYNEKMQIQNKKKNNQTQKEKKEKKKKEKDAPFLLLRTAVRIYMYSPLLEADWEVKLLSLSNPLT